MRAYLERLASWNLRCLFILFMEHKVILQDDFQWLVALQLVIIITLAVTIASLMAMPFEKNFMGEDYNENNEN